MLSQDFPYRKIAKALDISPTTVTQIARRRPSNLDDVDTFKKALIARAYSIGSHAFDYVTDAKLNGCSAPQLMMVAGVAIDKARDMEGSNRPVVNIVTMVGDLSSRLTDIKRKQQAIEAFEASQ